MFFLLCPGVMIETWLRIEKAQRARNYFLRVKLEIKGESLEKSEKKQGQKIAKFLHNLQDFTPQAFEEVFQNYRMRNRG